jgi:hypothetical protein
MGFRLFLQLLAEFPAELAADFRELFHRSALDFRCPLELGLLALQLPISSRVACKARGDKHVEVAIALDNLQLGIQAILGSKPSERVSLFTDKAAAEKARQDKIAAIVARAKASQNG